MNDMTPTSTIIKKIPDQWINRPADETFSSLDALFDECQDLANYSVANAANVNEIRVLTDEDGPIEYLGLEVNGEALSLSHWTYSQLCSLIGCPSGFMRTLPPVIQQYPLQHKLLNYRGELVKTYVSRRDPEMPVLRAVTSPTYGRIEDYKVVDSLRQIVGDGVTGHWKGAHVLNGGQPQFYASDRDMFVFLVDDQRPIIIGKDRYGNDDLLFRGVMAWNSEVGSRSFGVAGFCFRKHCDNRLIFGGVDFEQLIMRHSRNAPERFVEFAKPVLDQYIGGSARTIQEAVTTAKNRVIANKEEEQFDAYARLGFSKSVAQQCMELCRQEEGTEVRSAWDLAQSVTAYARQIPHQAERVDMEKKTRKLLAA